MNELSETPLLRSIAHTLPGYRYLPLRGDEIRIIILEPGQQNDDLELRITHENLPEADSGDTLLRRTSRQDVASTLPLGWEAHQTPEGRWFYWTGREILYAESDARSAYLDAEMVVRHDQSAQASPHYEALSYTWESNVRDRAVLVAGSWLQSALSVTASLDAALRQLRHPSESRRLWVDALCINQQDLDERATQVVRIGRIFGAAWRVVVWLGPSSVDSQLAFETLSYLGQQAEISTFRRIFSAIGAEQPEWHHLTHELPYSTQQWNALLSIFARSWFTRLWVIQEITLSRPNALFQCGCDTISFHLFRRAIMLLVDRNGLPGDLVYSVNRHWYMGYTRFDAPSVDLVNLARGHECMDDRDKVYGIAGLMGPGLRNAIIPSYESTVEQAYQQAFLANCAVTKRLDFLDQCSLPSGKLKMPSWVPDWRGSAFRFQGLSFGFQASGMSCAAYEITEQDELLVEGRIYGTSALVRDPADQDDESYMRKLRELKPRGMRRTSYPTGESMLSAWTRTVILDEVDVRRPVIDSFTLADWQKRMLLLLDRGPANIRHRMQGITDRNKEWLRSMRFFELDNGCFGLGSRQMQVGDCICVILGLHTPLVIRPCGPGAFYVVGWCYVHGIMDGEALLGPLDPAWTIEQEIVGHRYSPSYVAVADGMVLTRQKDDPRLPPLPQEWQRIDFEATADDPIVVDRFFNKNTGELINYDPRMTASSLIARGIELETIRLV